MQSVLHPIIGPKEPPQEDLSGRTALVTGGALGIGYEIARNLALQKARVIMLNRKEDQGDEAIAKIQAEGKEQGINVDINWVGVDLGHLKQVQEVFTKLSKEEERCDLLICSAGINANQTGVDADGIDRHFGVNCLGHFYAINLLLPLIRKTSKIPGAPAPRIVFESSEQHRLSPSNVHFGSLRELNDSNIDNTQVYCRTKLGMILYTKQLVNDIIVPNGDSIYVLAVHPGAVNTNMQQQWVAAYPGLLGKMIKNVSLALGRDVEQGSYSGLYAAIHPEIVEKNYNGYYFTDPGQPGKESSQANDPWLQWACWDLSERLIKEKLGDDALLPWK